MVHENITNNIYFFLQSFQFFCFLAEDGWCECNGWFPGIQLLMRVDNFSQEEQLERRQ